ncbi:hypothetical protein SBOR_6572 [Sclerotinia borealis F-4128]|uniref:Uncharacterized protein n=1 Tax=Sclerotinia borealis (strain F-4128) TaxID=1432307 RepID=W9CB26_SCLBF|nr:hypothetical protein SBOR_6572 [Sclerotinia borealis F-4128]
MLVSKLRQAHDLLTYPITSMNSRISLGTQQLHLLPSVTLNQAHRFLATFLEKSNPPPTLAQVQVVERRALMIYFVFVAVFVAYAMEEYEGWRRCCVIAFVVLCCVDAILQSPRRALLLQSRQGRDKLRNLVGA